LHCDSPRPSVVAIKFDPVLSIAAASGLRKYTSEAEPLGMGIQRNQIRALFGREQRVQLGEDVNRSPSIAD